MAGKIPEQFIDELMARVDIVDVIDSYVPLRKGGRDYVACCPFHSEKTPSFTVSREKQFFHCFGCHAHGTAIGFLMDFDHLSFVEAVHELAARVNMQVPTEPGRAAATPPARGRDVYQVLTAAAAFYRSRLKSRPQAVDYLKQRGLTGKIAADYGLGYAPPGWENLVDALAGDDGSNRNRLIEDLLDAGLLIQKEAANGRPGRCYDRFRDRIMFPIRDQRGRVIGFGGRVLGDDTPKYLNSPETSVFHKGKELYGLYEARKSVSGLDRLLVVEGYMDVIMLAQHGIRYAVATLGTATTGEHLERMFRHVPEVVFCFDGDRAGRDAAWRALENVLPVIARGRQARFMFLPDGEDPDSLIRKEKQAVFEARIENAIPLSAFLFDALAERVDIQSIDGYNRLVELARPLVAKIPDGVFKQEILVRLAERSRMPFQEFVAELDDGKSLRNAGRRPAMPKSGGRDRRPSLVRTVLALLLRYPLLAGEAGDLTVLRTLNQPGVGLLIELLELLHERPHLNGAALMEHWRDRDEGRYLGRLAMQELLLDDESQARSEFSAALDKLRELARTQRLEQLQTKSMSREGLSAKEKDELKQMHSRIEG